MDLEAHVLTAAHGVPYPSPVNHISHAGQADRLARVSFMKTTLCMLGLQITLHTSALHIADGPSDVSGRSTGTTFENLRQSGQPKVPSRPVSHRNMYGTILVKIG